jgi:predicted nuclease of predicted toxin-antitoxin system
VNELPEKWFSTDKFISEFADNSDRIVITKDSDFKNSFFIHRTPAKLIKVNLGNISNAALIKHIAGHLKQIEELNKLPYFIIEIDFDNTQYSTFSTKP